MFAMEKYDVVRSRLLTHSSSPTFLLLVSKKTDFTKITQSNASERTHTMAERVYVFVVFKSFFSALSLSLSNSILFARSQLSFLIAHTHIHRMSDQFVGLNEFKIFVCQKFKYIYRPARVTIAGCDDGERFAGTRKTANLLVFWCVLMCVIHLFRPHNAFKFMWAPTNELHFKWYTSNICARTYSTHTLHLSLYESHFFFAWNDFLATIRRILDSCTSQFSFHLPLPFIYARIFISQLP